MSKLVLLRHGQSVWNKENKFTGWVDVDLSEQGVTEAKQAGKLLEDYEFDFVFTSVLKRAQKTAELALASNHSQNYEIFENQALNERHYGSLQGLNKDETREKYGADQVHIWRRSFDVQPPDGESLKDTCERVLPYYKAQILPKLQDNKTILVAAHGNSLRALVKEIEEINNDEIVKVEIPTGVPWVYDFDAKSQNYQIISKS